MATVIIGAGIVGVTTAYYMAENDPEGASKVHLVENTDTLFASASGFAGGFLARDWMAPHSASLAALSFGQHAALAAQHDGAKRWGYALSAALSYGLPGGEEDKGSQRGEDWLRQGTSRSTAAPVVGGSKKSVPGWLHRQEGDRVEVLADDGTAGQVEPLPFCQYLLGKAQERGVQLHQPARVVAVNKEGGKLSLVTIEENGSQTTLACTRLVITAGCWTPRVYAELFPEDAARRPLPVHNYSGHSLVVKPKRTAINDCFALFAAGGGMKYCPEMFGRANGTLYLGGLNSSTLPLPDKASDSQPSQDQLDDLLTTCKRILGEDDNNIDVLRTGLCHRPATPWGAPLVLRLLDEKLSATSTEDSQVGGAGGVFASAGHGPWGISMGPGTGMVLAELVQGRALSADISGLGLREGKAGVPSFYEH